MNKKLLLSLLSSFILLFLISSVNAAICKGGDGYFYDCMDVYPGYYTYYNPMFKPISDNIYYNNQDVNTPFQNNYYSDYNRNYNVQPYLRQINLGYSGAVGDSRNSYLRQNSVNVYSSSRLNDGLTDYDKCRCKSKKYYPNQYCFGCYKTHEQAPMIYVGKNK